MAALLNTHLNQSQRGVDAVERGLCDRACAGGAVAEDAVELGAIVQQLFGSFADWGDGADDQFGGVELERTVLLARVACDDLGRRAPSDCGLDVD